MDLKPGPVYYFVQHLNRFVYCSLEPDNSDDRVTMRTARYTGRQEDIDGVTCAVYIDDYGMSWWQPVKREGK